MLMLEILFRPTLKLLLVFLGAFPIISSGPDFNLNSHEPSNKLSKNLPFPVDSSTLKSWIKNYKDNPSQPNITTSALISLSDLKAYIAAIEKEYLKEGKRIDGFRVHFIRYKSGEVSYNGIYKFTPDYQFTQVSLVFVPTVNFDSRDVSADDCKLSSGKFLVYPLAHLATINEGTGLCPPNCGGSFGNP